MKILIPIVKAIILASCVIAIYFTIQLNVPTILLTIVFLIISDIIQSSIHELGHLAGGLLSDHHFLFLHLGPVECCKKNMRGKRIAFSFNIKEMYGQCLMIPNPSNTNRFILYNAAGIIFNTLLTALSIICLLFSVSSMLFLFFASLILTGIFKITANIIPNVRKKEPNDMMIILWLSSSNKTKSDYFAYLRAYEKVIYGFQIESDVSTTKFNQKDIDHYNSYFADAKKKLADFNTVVNLTENP